MLKITTIRTFLFYLVSVLIALPALAQLPDFTNIAEQMSPRVVSITAVTIDQQGQEQNSYGSGFIYNKQGYILTNNHVTEDADQLFVRFSNRKEVPAELVGADVLTDISLLKVDPSGLSLQAIPVGDSENLKVGQWVVAIGSPFGFDYTLTAGVISALGRSLGAETYVPFIQSDVAVNRGNSGGPLFNQNGEVVGVNSRIFSGTGDFAGLSFAIPIHVAIDVADQLRSQGVVIRGWLGVAIRDVPRNLLEAFQLDRSYGALIAEVNEGGPASKGGLLSGDVIIKFNDQDIVHSGDLPVFVGATSPGSTAKVVVIRDGKRKTIQVQIGERRGEEIAGETNIQNSEVAEKLGLHLREMTPDEQATLGITSGIIITHVKRNSLAQNAGFIPGDIVTHFYQTRINSPNALLALVKQTPSGVAVPIRILRNQRLPLYLALRIP